MMRRLLLLLTVSGLFAVLLAPRAGQALDLPAGLNLGATSFLDGGPPAGPGFYFTEYVQYWHFNRINFPDGDKVRLPNGQAQLQAWVSLNQLIYQSNQSVLLGGKWGLDLILPVVALDLDPKQHILTDNGAGIGDLYIGPYLQWDPIMGDKGPIFMHRIEFQILVPTGRYSDKENLNPGSNFLSLDPYWAGTVFLGPKVSASWRLHYLWNDKNDDPNKFFYAGVKKVQAGQAVHLNFAADYEILPHQLRAGLNGYYLKQVTASTADGDVIPHSREQVLGIGPGLIYSFSQNDHLFLNVYFETAAENRAEGQRYNLRWVHHF